ncbi:DEKNAAC103053 [Brettanomyces naardenensis]|uniref:DEKNAAC103053 n=1 Tax=Brettanomyces naardenensis TaxID=13370 RepID=A0A448YMJ6_BRENA|nr:DEKNAAC103053 [Brettanomyces naardenensis]
MVDIPFNKLYVYDLDAEILDSLRLMYFDSVTYEQKTEDEYLKHREEYVHRTPAIQSLIVKPKPRTIRGVSKSVSGGITKSDFDKYNEQRTNNDQSPLTEAEFEAKMDELSISGSEEEDGEGDGDGDGGEEEKLYSIDEGDKQIDESSVSFLYTRSPLVLFSSSLLPEKKCFGAYKTTLDATETDSEPLRTLMELNSGPVTGSLSDRMSALFMIGGGHFAGAIVSHKPIVTKGNKGTAEELMLQSVNFVAHKTYHRYTTRRKQGGSQSASDNARGKANSAGSSLRRYNEQALQKDVEELLSSWKPLLDRCDKIFIKANGAQSHKSLLGKGTDDPLPAGDKRIRIFPFTTKRPTTMELRRAWCELSYLKTMDVPEDNRSTVEKMLKKRELLEKSRSQQQKPVNEVETDDDDRRTSEMISLLKKSKAPALISYIRKNNVDDINFPLTPESTYARNTPTLLHYASKSGLHSMCQVLLTNLKADPTIKNQAGRTAYQIASDDQTRYAFEIARYNLGEDYCDWNSGANVPEAKSREEVQTLLKEEEEAEKSRIRKLHEEELTNVRKDIKTSHDKRFGKGKTLGIPSTEQAKLESLSPEQRMKVMREQRARAAEARMRARK